MHSVDLSIYQSFIQLSPNNHLLDNLLTNPSIHPSILLLTYLSTCSLIHLSFTHLSNYPFAQAPILYPSTYPPVDLCIHLSSYLVTLPPSHLPPILYIYPSVQQSIHPSVCLPATHPISMVCRVSFMLMSHMGLQMHTRCTQSSDFQDIQ